jgi:hypothetical protein
MTTDQLQHKHLQAINIKVLDKMINEARIRKNKYAFHDTDGDLATGRLLTLEEVKELLVPCTSIMIEHSINCLQTVLQDLDEGLARQHVHEQISELKKQKEQL